MIVWFFSWKDISWINKNHYWRACWSVFTKRFYVQMCKCVSWWILFTFLSLIFSQDIHNFILCSYSRSQFSMGYEETQNTRKTSENVKEKFCVFRYFPKVWKLYDRESRYFRLDLWHWPSQIEFLIAKACFDVSSMKRLQWKIKILAVFFMRGRT